MRYLVTARVKPGRTDALEESIDDRSLGAGSVAGGEYLKDMRHARRMDDGSIRWVETCFCPTPLEEERPYWEQFFELTKVKDAHARACCRDLNGSEPWACVECDCTAALEEKMEGWGQPFMRWLRKPRT